MIKNISNLGDAALYCDFGKEVNKEINSLVIKYFKTLKNLITSELVFLLTSLPKSQYKAASPRFDIFFIMSCYTSTIITMEININCDLGEKSKHHSNKSGSYLFE